MTAAQQRAGRERRPTAIDEALAACRKAFIVVGVFSFAINILILASPIYMLQVYDRVLTTGHYETLALLTVIAGVALFILGSLEVLRSTVLSRVGRWLNQRLGPELLGVSLRTRLMGDTSGAQPIRDLGQIQSFLTGQGLGVFFDSPWVPVFVVLIWLLHPMLGVVALLSALVLLVMSLLNDWLTRKPIAKANQAQIAATLQAEATIRNAEVVRAMGMQPALVRRWSGVNEGALEATQVANERGGTLVGYTKFLRFFVQMAILGVGALLVLKGELSAGGMVAASILLGRALAPVEQAMGAWRTFAGARLAYGRLQQRLEAIPAEPARTRLPDPKGHLSVEAVTYAPAGAERPVLRQVGFALEPGEACAASALRRPARARSAGCWSARRSRPRAPCGSTGPRSATGTRSSSGATSATCRRTWSCSRARSARTSPAWARAPTRRWSRPPASRMRTR
jgi:ABC-type protease/lipase transport system fused ATPase/permease subunit